MDCSLPHSSEEAEVVRRCQQGDRHAFASLVERYQRRLFSLIYRLVRRRDEVEDLAQEVFLKAFSSLRSYNFQSSFATWLNRIAVNHCYDFLRRQAVARVSYQWQVSEEIQGALALRMEQGGESSGRDPEQQIALRDLVLKLLERAPAKDQAILVLKEIEGFSVEEIAEILEVNPTTVKVRLHRARKRMLEDLRAMANKAVGHVL